QGGGLHGAFALVRGAGAGGGDPGTGGGRVGVPGRKEADVRLARLGGDTRRASVGERRSDVAPGLRGRDAFEVVGRGTRSGLDERGGDVEDQDRGGGDEEVRGWRILRRIPWEIAR